jgi:hypothetical protein
MPALLVPRAYALTVEARPGCPRLDAFGDLVADRIEELNNYSG